MTTSTSTRRSKMSAYFKGVRAEMRKVIWPNKKELLNYTAVVIAISALVALIVWLLDFIIHGAFGLII